MKRILDSLAGTSTFRVGFLHSFVGKFVGKAKALGVCCALCIVFWGGSCFTAQAYEWEWTYDDDNLPNTISDGWNIGTADKEWITQIFRAMYPHGNSEHVMDSIKKINFTKGMGYDDEDFVIEWDITKTYLVQYNADLKSGKVYWDTKPTRQYIGNGKLYATDFYYDVDSRWCRLIGMDMADVKPTSFLDDVLDFLGLFPTAESPVKEGYLKLPNAVNISYNPLRFLGMSAHNMVHTHTVTEIGMPERYYYLLENDEQEYYYYNQIVDWNDMYPERYMEDGSDIDIALSPEGLTAWAKFVAPLFPYPHGTEGIKLSEVQRQYFDYYHDFLNMVVSYDFRHDENSIVRHLVFPEYLKAINTQAFLNRNSVGLRSIILPPSLQYISDQAFSGQSLEVVTFQTYSGGTSDLKYIGRSAFMACKPLKHLTLPLARYSYLQDTNLPANLKYKGFYVATMAFAQLISLETADMGGAMVVEEGALIYLPSDIAWPLQMLKFNNLRHLYHAFFPPYYPQNIYINCPSDTVYVDPNAFAAKENFVENYINVFVNHRSNSFEKPVTIQGWHVDTLTNKTVLTSVISKHRNGSDAVYAGFFGEPLSEVTVKVNGVNKIVAVTNAAGFFSSAIVPLASANSFRQTITNEAQHLVHDSAVIYYVAPFVSSFQQGNNNTLRQQFALGMQAGYHDKMEDPSTDIIFDKAYNAAFADKYIFALDSLENLRTSSYNSGYGAYNAAYTENFANGKNAFAPSLPTATGSGFNDGRNIGYSSVMHNETQIRSEGYMVGYTEGYGNADVLVSDEAQAVYLRNYDRGYAHGYTEGSAAVWRDSAAVTANAYEQGRHDAQKGSDSISIATSAYAQGRAIAINRGNEDGIALAHQIAVSDSFPRYYNLGHIYPVSKNDSLRHWQRGYNRGYEDGISQKR